MAELDTVEVGNLVGGLGSLLTETLLGDAHLRARVPDYVLTNVRAHFEFVATRIVDKRFIFGLIRNKKSERLADLIVDIGLRPSSIPPPAHPPQLRRVLPDFLTPPNPKMIDTVYFDLGDGSRRFGWTVGKAPADQKVTQRRAMDAIWTLSAWCRRGRPGRHVAYEAFAAPHDRILKQVLDEVAALLVRFGEEAKSVEEPWTVDTLELHLRARLDGKGQVHSPIQDLDETASHRADMKISLEWARNGLEHMLVVNQLPVDMRVSPGELRPFLDKLRGGAKHVHKKLLKHLVQRASTKKVEELLDKTITKDSVSTFLADTRHEEEAAVVTVRDKKLETLIALRGELAGRAAELVIEIPHSDDGHIINNDLKKLSVHVALVDLEGLPAPGKLSAKSNVYIYVAQMCDALMHWQKAER